MTDNTRYATDWLTIPDGPLVKKRDPMEYVRRLRFHRQVSTPADYGSQ